AGVIDVTAATIASNVGSGIDLVDNVAVSLLNTILVGNTDDQCTVLGTGREDIISLGYNLSSDATCNLVHVTDRPSTALMLGALADDGGPTRTMALLAGSVAVDGGTCEKITTDQREFLRPAGNCDIGAYEYAAVLPVELVSFEA